MKPFQGAKDYRQTFSKGGMELSNIIGVLEGSSKKKEWVVVSAHYDHLGILKAIKGDSIANGADDDASGVTAVLALADYWKKEEEMKEVLYSLHLQEKKKVCGDPIILVVK